MPQAELAWASFGSLVTSSLPLSQHCTLHFRPELTTRLDQLLVHALEQLAAIIDRSRCNRKALETPGKSKTACLRTNPAKRNPGKSAPDLLHLEPWDQAEDLEALWILSLVDLRQNRSLALKSLAATHLCCVLVKPLSRCHVSEASKTAPQGS